MPSIGDKLGHYKILSEVGRGGMGAVYRAHDSRLGRDVALKISGERFSERFEREARVVASLNHPNICTLFDVGPDFLVMELIEGETPQGPLSLETIIEYARQMADALDYAHERGVTHRDLKPANLKITPEGTLKVLDFGLAKVGRSSVSGDVENSPTLTMGMTEAGMILGTAAYMAPEQAKGKNVDKRADIWAFGVVLYELSTGKRPFHGEDISELLVAVLRDEPKFDEVPERLRPLITRCLQKDPRKRLRDLGDVQELLNPSSSMMAAPVITTAPPAKPYLWMGAAAVLAIGLGVALWAPWRSADSGPAAVTRLDVDLGQEAIASTYNTFAISPDGRRILFTVRNADGKMQLATRLLDSNEVTRLPGTEGAIDAFFSPTGQEIAFQASGQLKKIGLSGGAAVDVARAAQFFGGQWGSTGDIVYSRTTVSPIQGTPQSGTEQSLSKLVPPYITHRWPSLTAAGDFLLYSASSTVSSLAGGDLWVQPLPSGVPKLLVRGAYNGRFVQTGGKEYVLFIRDGAMFGSAFDPKATALIGPTIPLINDIAGDPFSGAGHFDLSKNGTLMYRAGREAEQTWPALWMDKTGETKPLISERALYVTPKFSPNGKKLALSSRGAGGLAIYDLETGTVNRFPGLGYPVWTPDGKYVAARDSSGPTVAISWIRADGAGEKQVIFKTGNNIASYSFTPDGKTLIITELPVETGTDIYALPLDLSDPEHPKAGQPVPLVKTPMSESFPILSGDGKWLAYTSTESGRWEVYVKPYPSLSGRWQISSDGGTTPLWAPDGRSLYFVHDSHIYVADITAQGDAIAAGRPRLWSPTPVRLSGDNLSYAIHPDGQRFAVYPAAPPDPEEKGNAHVTFVFNFLDDMKRRIEAAK